MTPEQAVAFLLFAVVAAGTPGPSNLLLTATGASVGVRRGLPCLLGVSVGMGVMMFVVAFGLGSVVLASPAVLRGLNWMGAAFPALAGLEDRDGARRGGEAAGERPVGFLGAAAFQWINPKSWLVCASAAGTYLHAGAGSALEQATGVRRPLRRGVAARAASCGSPSAPPRSASCAPSAPGGRSTSPWARCWPARSS